MHPVRRRGVDYVAQPEVFALVYLADVLADIIKLYAEQENAFRKARRPGLEGLGRDFNLGDMPGRLRLFLRRSGWSSLPVKRRRIVRIPIHGTSCG
jgi:hypothetical protein